MTFEEVKERSEVENLEEQIRLVTQSLKLQKAAWEVERNELHRQIQAHQREIKWMSERSIKHVLGQWLWTKISRYRQNKIESFKDDNYF